MAAADDQPSSGVSRRDALRLLAASTTTVAAGSLIISQPAFADNGSVACGYEFTDLPTMKVKWKNDTTKKDSLSISVDKGKGDCKCSNKNASFRYAFYVETPVIGGGNGWINGGTGWITSKDASVSNPSVLWPDGGGQIRVSVGFQVTCLATGGESVVQCWFGTATTTVEPAKSDGSLSVVLTISNSSNNPTGIPPCGPSALRSSQLAASGSINLVAGLLPTTDAAIADDQTVDPGVIEPGTTVPSTTTSTTTPSTTTSSTSTSTTTSTTSTTAPTTSTTAPSTTAPPSPPGG